MPDDDFHAADHQYAPAVAGLNQARLIPRPAVFLNQTIATPKRLPRMKRPILWVTGSLTAATALAATLLIATATRGSVRPEFQAPVGVVTPIQTPTADCPESHCKPVAAEAARPTAD